MTPITTLAVLATAALASSAEAAPFCSSAEKDAFNSLRGDEYTTCLSFLSGFKACSTACVDNFKSVAARAPNCSTSGFETQWEIQTKVLEKCQDANANTTGRYIPKVAPSGTVNCTWDESDDWKNKYDRAADTCVVNLFSVFDQPTCEDKCLANFEEGIEEAPMCLAYSYGDYTLREQMKYRLVKCLEIRNQSLDDNAVLQSATGKWVRSAATSATATPKTTTESTAVSYYTISANAVVVVSCLAFVVAAMM